MMMMVGLSMLMHARHVFGLEPIQREYSPPYYIVEQ